MERGKVRDIEEEINLEILIKPQAELDLFETFKFYNEQSSGLGGEFIRCVDAKLEFINRNPHGCLKLYKDFRIVRRS
ncbi:MAG: hypothetical protein U0586_00655 [Candidatus Brocadiaceae bacterium]